MQGFFQLYETTLREEREGGGESVNGNGRSGHKHEDEEDDEGPTTEGEDMVWRDLIFHGFNRELNLVTSRREEDEDDDQHHEAEFDGGLKEGVEGLDINKGGKE